MSGVRGKERETNKGHLCCKITKHDRDRFGSLCKTFVKVRFSEAMVPGNS